MTVFTFVIQRELITSSFCKILGWSILILLFAKFIMGDILADTTIHRRICQHATILEEQSWSLDCLCHCDVFSTINWLLWFLKRDLDSYFSLLNLSFVHTSSTSTTVTTSASFELPSSHARVTSIKFTKRQLVSEWQA